MSRQKIRDSKAPDATAGVGMVGWAGRGSRSARDYATPPVQRKASATPSRTPADDADGTHAAAATGVSGGGAPLPHADAIQRAFGLHTIDGVTAHVGGQAAAACEQIGARAYATGDKVAFAESPDLYTAAHEAAHVVQQRGGVQLKANVGQQGDQYERHADLVADAVVAGRSAETLLSRGPSGSSSRSQAVQKQQAPDDKKPVARGNLSGLRTAAQGYIGDYYSAAHAGILAFEGDLSTSFDWGAFWLAVGGNLLWASAAFATGGTAFLISVGGIALSSTAAASSVHSKRDFRTAALKQIGDITKHLNKQVDRVTRAVDADAKKNSWDDSRTRLEMLQRMFKKSRPEFILKGAVPNVNQPAIAATVREQLLIKASQQSQGPSVSNLGRSFHAAVFKEVYDVDAIEYRNSMMGVYPVLKPVSQWFYKRRSARIVGGSPEIQDINKSINEVYDAYGTKSKIDPSIWQMRKELVLSGKMPFGVTYVLGPNNAVKRIDASQFRGFLKTRGTNPDTYLPALLRMIQKYAKHPMPIIPRLTK